MTNLSQLKRPTHPATFALAVFIDDRPPADSWEPPEEPETTVLLVDGNDERYDLGEELENALIEAVESHSGEICDKLHSGTDHQAPPVYFCVRDNPVCHERQSGRHIKTILEDKTPEDMTTDELVTRVTGDLKLLYQWALADREQAADLSSSADVADATARISYLRSAAKLLNGCYKGL